MLKNEYSYGKIASPEAEWLKYNVKRIGSLRWTVHPAAGPELDSAPAQLQGNVPNFFYKDEQVGSFLLQERNCALKKKIMYALLAIIRVLS